MEKANKKSWQRPTLPRTSRSTIGARAFYFRVRDGNGYFHSAMATSRPVRGTEVHPVVGRKKEGQYGQASRMISNGRLNASPRLHRRPIDQLFWLVPSVESSSMGHLILGRASRLDAFSGYPFRTWLPCECRWRDNRYTRGPSTSVLSY